MEFTAAIQTPNIGISEMINAMTSQPQVYTVPAYGNIETSPYGQIQHYVTHVAPGAYIAAPHSAHHQQLIHHQPNLHNRIEFPPPPQPVLEAPRPKEWKRDEDRERERRYSDRDNRDRSERYRSDRDRDRLSTGGGRSRDRERGSDRERGERFLSTSLPKEHHHSRRRGDRERDRHDRGGDATYSRSRDRSRSFRSRSRSRSRSWDREEGQKIGEDIRSFVNAARNASDDDLRQFDYRKTPPNNTIMVRGLAQHITENDILDDILDCQVTAKDIRLVRKKDSGISRGFAFVEFSDIHDAINWMEQKQVFA